MRTHALHHDSQNLPPTRLTELVLKLTAPPRVSAAVFPPVHRFMAVMRSPGWKAKVEEAMVASWQPTKGSLVEVLTQPNISCRPSVSPACKLTGTSHIRRPSNRPAQLFLYLNKVEAFEMGQPGQGLDL